MKSNFNNINKQNFRIDALIVFLINLKFNQNSFKSITNYKFTYNYL